MKAQDLSAEHVSETPINVDWSDALDENGDVWMSWEAQTCEKCGEVVVVPRGGETTHEGALNEAGGDAETDCDGNLSDSEGPMMNYFYPCAWRGAAEKVGVALAGVPLCLVEFEDGRRGLALTGGGMDMTWEICAAYVALGFLPPVHFAGRLPRMANGPGWFQTQKPVIAACRRSASVAVQWAKNSAREIRSVVRWYGDRAAKEVR